MTRNFIYAAIILLTSCNSKDRKDTNNLERADGYEITATTPDGKKIKQTISNEQAKELLNGFSKKMTRDTTYNEFNKPRLVIHKLIGKTVNEYFVYNDKQQLTSQYGQNQYSSPSTIYNEVAKIKYLYNNDLLIEIRKYNVENRLISSKWEDTPIIKYKYDSQKRLIEKWFLNEIGELRDEYAILKFDKNGENIGWYNLKGNKDPK